MKYKIALQKTDEGFSVSVPGLPGCWSQGTTEEEALENIRDAIGEYLAETFPQARLWGRRVMREYWAQGELERRRILPVGRLYDRKKVESVFSTWITTGRGAIRFGFRRAFGKGT